jgi:hypothetical protein
MVCKRRIIVRLYTLWQAMHMQELQYPERKMPGSYLILYRCTADYWLYQVLSTEAHRTAFGNVVDRCRTATYQKRKYGELYNTVSGLYQKKKGTLKIVVFHSRR